jgi:hypothetical protein
MKVADRRNFRGDRRYMARIAKAPRKQQSKKVHDTRPTMGLVRGIRDFFAATRFGDAASRGRCR